MGRPSNAEIAARANQGAAPKVEPVNITYLPREGDPAKTEWNGHVFHANVPVPVRHPGMIEQAKGNPWFRVEGEAKGSVASSGEPETAEDYRAYAVLWLKDVRSYAEMVRRWDAEQPMREACGVGTDDYDYLESVFGPKRAELKRASEAD